MQRSKRSIQIHAERNAFIKRNYGNRFMEMYEEVQKEKRANVNKRYHFGKNYGEYAECTDLLVDLELEINPNFYGSKRT